MSAIVSDYKTTFSNTPSTSSFVHNSERKVTAVVGPTNTGKTHYAIERMLAYKSGMIGLPLRLLAREIYDRLLERRPAAEIALITGEEKIIPRSPRYWVCTVEAMPLEQSVEFMAIDEIQLAATPERGRTFTSRILYARGTAETLFLGSDTMVPILRQLFPNISFLGRERFSKLSYAGSKKITRLPRRTAIVAFSADAVYAIAELVRRQRGGTAVILGALSPRTRNAQAALYQNGEVDYLIATDAIGMGLNMDIDHVAFANRRKFDGRGVRNLTDAETAQIAGRAGRYLRDGTFGITSDCHPFSDETLEAIEEHRFDPVRGLFWRSEALEFSSLPALIKSLETRAPRPELFRARADDDEQALSLLVRDPQISNLAKGGAALSLLWDVCQLPDFRKVSADQHTTLIGDIYLEMMNNERIREDWLAPRVDRLERTDGDIDTLSARIAYIRSWTYLTNRKSWIVNPSYWQERTRKIEDALSDALHERLTQRFVDRRTSVLMKRLKDQAPLLAGVTEDGEVIVEGQFVGRLMGFEFIIDPRATGAQAKPVRAAADKALQPILAARASELANADPKDLTILPDGSIQWRSAIVAKLEKGPAQLRPKLTVRNYDMIPAALRGRVEDRLNDYFAARIEGLLGPLIALQHACEATGEQALTGLTRGVAWRLVENFGASSRTLFGNDLKQINQDERGKLRKLGMRFGEYTLFMPALLKPAPAGLLTLLWALWNERDPISFATPRAGLVSIEIAETTPHAYYYASGYRPSGTRAVRIDMLERLAGEIRRARDNGDRREGFEATQQMMSLVGCSGEDFETILMSLSFRKNTIKRQVPKKPTAEEKPNPETQNPSDIKQGETPENTSVVVPPVTDGDASKPVEQELVADDSLADAKQADSSPVEVAPQVQANAPEPTATIANDADAIDKADATVQNDTEKSELTNTQNTDSSTPAPTPEPGETEEIEITLWRYQAKNPARYKGSKNDKKRGDQNAKPGQKGKGPKGGKQGQKPHQKRVQNPHMHKPRHLKTADPDSPFAVLAALKNDKDKAE